MFLYKIKSESNLIINENYFNANFISDFYLDFYDYCYICKTYKFYFLLKNMASKSSLSDLISKCKKFFSSDVVKEWKELYEKWNDLYKKWKDMLNTVKKKNKTSTDKKKLLKNSTELLSDWKELYEKWKSVYEKSKKTSSVKKTTKKATTKKTTSKTTKVAKK